MIQPTTTPEIYIETAYAKINLALHVRARRADGYHEIETIFAFVDSGDRLEVSRRDDGAITLTVEGPFAQGLEGDDNLVMQAARALQPFGNGMGADIRLIKNLPVAAGLGGGSADAAAALRALLPLWGIRPMDIDLAEIALSLGADVPACLASVTLRGSGVGERLEPVDLGMNGAPVLLVNPQLPCPTGPVFRGWDGSDRGPLGQYPADWRNDLETPALKLVPEIKTVLTTLAGQKGVTLARMSGSGATCFALFESGEARDEAEAIISTAHPGWWTMAGALL